MNNADRLLSIDARAHKVGLSLTRLARLAKVSPQTITRWSRTGEVRPRTITKLEYRLAEIEGEMM